MYTHKSITIRDTNVKIKLIKIMPYHSMQGHLSITQCNNKGKAYNLDYLNTCAKMLN